MYTMDTCSILCCKFVVMLHDSLIHLFDFQYSTVGVMNSRVSGQCLYTLPIRYVLSTKNTIYVFIGMVFLSILLFRRSAL